MYLSQLMIDVGADPDRPRPGRLWLRNIYRVHQRLCMAFPSAERKTDDPAFLRPYAPNDFRGARGKDVHAERSTDGGFLFRVDPIAGGSPVIVVQSAARPDWDYAFHNAAHLLAAPPALMPFDPVFHDGGRFRFRLRANPTVAKKTDNKKNRQHLALFKEEDQVRWLHKKADGEDQRRSAGFHLEAVRVMRDGPRSLSKNGDADTGKATDKAKPWLLSVLFEGELAVTDADRFGETLRAGIGRGKAFGFGLLSLARSDP